MDISLPVFLLLGATLLIFLTDADIRLASFFYSPHSGWFLKDQPLWQFFYQYGMIPAFLFAFIALATVLAGFFDHRFTRYRKKAIFLLLLLVIGPGLVINTTLKDHWKRPRPSDISSFGGSHPYLPIWKFGDDQQSRSFPSGHAAIGYYLLAPFFLFRKRSRHLARFFLGAGLIYGSLMGFGRMVQGGHFFSDVVWSCGLVYITGVVLYYLLRMDLNS
jgi:membrane-associated PAP2 superfamily phosphatase